MSVPPTSSPPLSARSATESQIQEIHRILKGDDFLAGQMNNIFSLYEAQKESLEAIRQAEKEYIEAIRMSESKRRG